MKYLLIICNFCISYTILAQTNQLQNSVVSLKEQIGQTQGIDQLTLLDSLSHLIKNKKEFGYDTIAQKTIESALRLNKNRVAGRHTADLIFYLTNRAGKPEEGIQLFDDFLTKKIALNDPAITAQLYLNGADSYFFAGKTENSIPYYITAGEYAQKANDSLLLGNSKNYLSDALAGIGKFAEAATVLTEAETIFEQTKDTIHLLTSRNSRANLFSRIGFFEEANKIRNEVIDLAERTNDYRMLQSVYFNAAIDNNKTNDHKTRIHNLKKALFYVRKAKLKSYEPKILSGLLTSYALTDSLSKAKKIADTIQANPEGYTQGLDRAYYTKAMAFYEYAQGDYRTAISYAEDQLNNKEHTDFENTTTIQGFLAKAYEKIGNDRKAYEHHKTYAKLRDSILAVQNVRAFTYYQTLYETEKKEAEIQFQNAQIAELNSKNKLKNQWIFIGGISFLTFFTFVWLARSRRYAQKKQALQTRFTQKLINGQEKERTRLARELHDSVGQKLMLLSRKTKTSGDKALNVLTGDTLQELRAILKGLHPATLEKLGFSVAIQSLINDIDAHTPIFFTAEIDNVDTCLNKDVSLHIYRIIQEVLSNIIKHSETKSASVVIKKDAQHIITVIKDHGKGFRFIEKYKSAKSLGMKTLLERAKIIHSKIEINSILDEGTTVTLHTPIQNE
ncbi:ATP-binding protein [Dokdonia pacifica]|nr:sensor histidine kinase [Dokdonia pacifica]